jgi:hypothetical protein
LHTLVQITRITIKHLKSKSQNHVSHIIFPFFFFNYHMLWHLGKRLLKTTLFLPRIREGLLRTSLKYKIGEIPSHVSEKEAIGHKNIYKAQTRNYFYETSPDNLATFIQGTLIKKSVLPLSSQNTISFKIYFPYASNLNI